MGNRLADYTKTQLKRQLIYAIAPAETCEKMTALFRKDFFLFIENKSTKGLFIPFKLKSTIRLLTRNRA